MLVLRNDSDGIEDPDFVTADEADPIPDEQLPEGAELDDPLADFAGTPMPDFVECFMASNTIEAKFVADQLMEQGIPAIADKIDMNLAMGGFQPSYGDMDPRSVCDRTTFQKPKPGSISTSNVASPGRKIRTAGWSKQCGRN